MQTDNISDKNWLETNNNTGGAELQLQSKMRGREEVTLQEPTDHLTQMLSSPPAEVRLLCLTSINLQHDPLSQNNIIQYTAQRYKPSLGCYWVQVLLRWCWYDQSEWDATLSWWGHNIPDTKLCGQLYPTIQHILWSRHIQVYYYMITQQPSSAILTPVCHPMEGRLYQLYQIELYISVVWSIRILSSWPVHWYRQTEDLTLQVRDILEFDNYNLVKISAAINMFFFLPNGNIQSLQKLTHHTLTPLSTFNIDNILSFSLSLSLIFDRHVN